MKETDIWKAHQETQDKKHMLNKWLFEVDCKTILNIQVINFANQIQKRAANMSNDWFNEMFLWHLSNIIKAADSGQAYCGPIWNCFEIQYPPWRKYR